MRNYGMNVNNGQNNGQRPLIVNRRYRIEEVGEDPFIGVLVSLEEEPMAPGVNGQFQIKYTYTFDINGQRRIVEDFNLRNAILQQGGRRKTRKAKKSKKAKSRKSRR